jgi:hypothetical protein
MAQQTLAQLWVLKTVLDSVLLWGQWWVLKTVLEMGML